MQPRDLNEYRLALAAADLRIDSLIEEGARMIEDLAAYKLENAKAHRQLLADRKIIERTTRQVEQWKVEREEYTKTIQRLEEKANRYLHASGVAQLEKDRDAPTGKYKFFFEARIYYTDQRSMTVEQLLFFVDGSRTYLFFQQDRDAEPRRYFSHAQSVDLTQKPWFFQEIPARM